MRTSKFLIFKIESQQFAIRTNVVLNIIEKAKITSQLECDYNKPYFKSAFSFRGMTIPIIDMREILGMKIEETKINNCILVVEILIDNIPDLAGISIDEITEIAEFDDFFAYPYIPIKKNNCGDLREGIIIRNNEPVIIINSNKIFASNLISNQTKPIEIFSN